MVELRGEFQNHAHNISQSEKGEWSDQVPYDALLGFIGYILLYLVIQYGNLNTQVVNPT